MSYGQPEDMVHSVQLVVGAIVALADTVDEEVVLIHVDLYAGGASIEVEEGLSAVLIRYQTAVTQRSQKMRTCIILGSPRRYALSNKCSISFSNFSQYLSIFSRV